MNWIKQLFGTPAEPAPALESAAPPVRALAPATPVYTRYAFSDPSVRIVAVGDLHGRIDLLQQLARKLDVLAQDPSRRLVEVYLGDYIDRAGNAKAVVDFLAKRILLKDRKVICLAGNHEQMLLSALQSDKEFQTWVNFGGQPTLLSYGVSLQGLKSDLAGRRSAFAAALPPDHLSFLQKLDFSYQQESFFFAHAGVRPGKALSAQDARDLLWIRDTFLKSNADFGATVVHGHTPVTRPEFRPNRIGIDTGAYYSGTLTCLVITSASVSVLDASSPTSAR